MGIKYGAIRGTRLRRHRRMLRRVLERGEIYLRREYEFRMAERLHCAGLVTAVASKANWLGVGRRAFRELTLFSSAAEARRRYPCCVMPRLRVVGRGRGRI